MSLSLYVLKTGEMIKGSLIRFPSSGGKESAGSQRHAQIVLKADEEADWTNAQIAEALDVGNATGERVRRRMTERGTGNGKHAWVTLAWSQTEGGHKRWTVRMLAETLVRISHNTLRVMLEHTVAKQAFQYATGGDCCVRASHGRGAGSGPASLPLIRRGHGMRDANKCWP